MCLLQFATKALAPYHLDHRVAVNTHFKHFTLNADRGHMDCELFGYLEFPEPSKAYQVAASEQNTGILAPCADVIP